MRSIRFYALLALSGMFNTMMAALPVTLEDFETGAALTWTSLGDPAIFGAFVGVVPNSNQDTVNASGFVGEYAKGPTQYGGLEADLPAGFTLNGLAEFHLQVLPPDAATSLTLRLYSPSQGIKAITAEIQGSGTWQALTFGFEAFQTIHDFTRVQILFDQNLASEDTWYFDNLIQSETSGDPCEGAVPDLNIIDDFDCQRNVAISTGLDRLTLVVNPVLNGSNSDPQDNVGEYADPVDQWSALVYNFGAPIDLTVYSRLMVKIWSPSIVPLLFKLEGGSSPAVEVFTTVTAAGEWVTYQIDFTGETGDHSRLAIFFNAGQMPPGNINYYIDDLEWLRGPYSGCVLDFETTETSYEDWVYFGNGDGNGTVFQVLDNPDPTGANTSDHVGVFVEYPGGNTWAGMYSQSLPAPVALPASDKTIRMKVWADHAAIMTMKLESGLNGAPGSGDVDAEYTTPNAWAELTWDFTNAVPNGAQYARLTLIMDRLTVPDEIKMYFFDDVVVADAECGTSGILSPDIAGLSCYPNPANDFLVVSAIENCDRISLLDITGRTLMVRPASSFGDVKFNTSTLQRGLYLISASDASGVLLASGKFVKK